MKRWHRGGMAVALGLGVASLGLFSPAAHAESAPVSGGSWFWREQVPRNVENPVIPVGTPGALPAPDVPAGDFAVAVKAPADAPGQDVAHDKETFLHIDTSLIAAGSTVDRFTLTVAEDANSLNAAGASIGAFPVTGFFVDGAAAAPWSERPAYDPNGVSAKGARSANGTWTFDLKPIVAAWTAGTVPNNGIALVPIEVTTGTEPWQVLWKGVNPPPTTTGVFTPPATTGSTDTAPSDTQPVSDPSSFESPAFGPVTIAPDTTAPITVPGSVSTGGAPTVSVRRASAPKRPDRGITAGFVFAGLLVAGLAFASMVALGELGEPIPERRGSVLRALERRVAGTA